MRAAPTHTEEIAWRFLRATCAELGVEVRRQVPIGRFIVDFLVPALRLVIEIDGSSHDSKHHADARRDAKLERAGYRIVRLRASALERCATRSS